MENTGRSRTSTLRVDSPTSKALGRRKTSTLAQYNAVGGVLEKLRQEGRVRSQSASNMLDNLEEKPEGTSPSLESPTKKRKITKLFSKSRRVPKGNTNPLTLTDTIEALKNNRVSTEALKTLRCCVQMEKAESVWMDQFFALGSEDALFEALYPLKISNVESKETFICALLSTILAIYSSPTFADRAFSSLSIVKERSFTEVLQQTKEAPNTPVPKKKRAEKTMAAKRAGSVPEPPLIASKRVKNSQLGILLELFVVIMSVESSKYTRVQGKVVDILIQICKLEKSSDLLLSVLVEREKQLLKECSGISDAILQEVSKEGHSIVPFVYNLFSTKKVQRPPALEVSLWYLLNRFIIGLSTTEKKFLVQNTTLELGIVPVIEQLRECAIQENNKKLKEQLSLFFTSLEEEHQVMSETMKPEEGNESDSFKIILGVSDLINIPYTPDTTPIQIIERAVIQEQYLRTKKANPLHGTSMGELGLFLDDGSTTDGCCFIGRWLSDTEKKISEYNLTGPQSARVGLKPWDINVSLANVLPEDTELPVIHRISILPDLPVHLVISKLTETYGMHAEMETITFGLYWGENASWLDPKELWLTYPELSGAQTVLLFTSKFKPLKIHYEKEVTVMDCFEIHGTIGKITSGLVKRHKIPMEQRRSFGLFLFPLLSADDIGKRAASVVEEKCWKEEQKTPGIYLLSVDATMGEILEDFPEQNFLLHFSRRPRYLSVSLHISSLMPHNKQILAYYNIPVRSLVDLIHLAFGLDPTLRYSLAVLQDGTCLEENEFIPLRKQHSLQDQSIAPGDSIYLCHTLFSDDPFDDEANIWEIQDTPESKSSAIHEDGRIEMKAGTLNILIRHLTNPQSYDSDFVNTFLITYESFTTSKWFLRKLIERFKAPENVDLAVSKVVQQRVCVIMKTWVSKCMPIIPDVELLKSIAEFSTDVEAIEPAAKALQKSVANKLAGKGSSAYCITVPPPSVLFSGEPILWDTVEPLELARQLTLSSFDAFQTITYRELFGQPWSKPRLHHKCPNLMKLIAQFNWASSWTTNCIVQTPLLADRIKTLCKMIQLAMELRELGNFSLLIAVMSGLNNSAVSRLQWTRSKVPKRLTDAMDELEELTSMESSFKEYRQALSSQEPPVVPYMGVLTSDLTFIDDGNPDKINGGLINFYKRTLMFKILKQIEIFQQVPYNLTRVPEIHKWLDATELLDEEKLFNLSLKIEPRNAKKGDIE